MFWLYQSKEYRENEGGREMKLIFHLFIMVLLSIAMIQAVKMTNSYVDLKEQCNIKGGIGYSYINENGDCCITSASGWHETEEESVTRFIFGKNKRWREFTCVKLTSDTNKTQEGNRR